MELMSKLKEMIPWKRKPVEPHEVLTLRDDINRLFDRMLMSPFDSDWTPLSRFGGADIAETEDGVEVRIEVPGLDPRDLEVMVRRGTLYVRYERADNSRFNGAIMAHRYAFFERTIPLPDGIDTSRPDAMCKHGVLTVCFPWKEAEEGRRVVVSVQ